MRVTPEFVDKFQNGDIRGNRFWTDGQSKEIHDIGTFTEGYAYYKFTNLKNDGTMIEGANSFPDTDFPMFRLADVYLMLAECQVVGGVSSSFAGHNGIWYLNQVRKRAGLGDIANATADNIIDERARELAWECHRRSDLVRFGLFTSSSYLWAYKGMNNNTGTAHGVDSHYNLFPIPSSDMMSNTNLVQNPGY